MTLKVFKSVIEGLPYDYAQEVEAHRQALLAHRFVGDAAPSAPALIEQAVRRVQTVGEPDDFVADYTVFDDTPPEQVPTDAERKQALITRVRLAERDASEAIIGPGKLRLMTMDMTRVFAKPEADRSENENAVLAAYASVQARLDAVHYHAATLEAQIDDLAPEGYAQWSPSSFPA